MTDHARDEKQQFLNPDREDERRGMESIAIWVIVVAFAVGFFVGKYL